LHEENGVNSESEALLPAAPKRKRALLSYEKRKNRKERASPGIPVASPQDKKGKFVVSYQLQQKERGLPLSTARRDLTSSPDKSWKKEGGRSFRPGMEAVPLSLVEEDRRGR